ERRQRLRGVAGPEAVEVAGQDGEAGDAGLAHGVEDLAALVVAAAPVAVALHGVAVGPFRPVGRHEAFGQVLRVDALVVRAQRGAPDLPGRGGVAQAIEEPGLLLRAEHGLRRAVLAV